MSWVWLNLAGLGFLIYSNTFTSAFVFDDFAATSNRAIQHLADIPGLWHAFNTRFIVGLSLAFNYALGGENVFGYHLFNTLVHILNAFLVYKLVGLTLRSSPKSLIGDQGRVDSRQKHAGMTL